ncbi:MAG: hypothetical protein Q8M20_15445 [Rhodocyclaceae bacterium]|nr:hypothetical protein [Rhodocyclaceae bacterium]MDZ4215103.1 hypothetical protein [Rhodocyclaceae bacterium]
MLLGSLLAIIGMLLILAGRPSWRALQNRPQRTWRVDRFVYRHHRLFGALILLGASIFLALLATHHTAIFKADPWLLKGLPLAVVLLQAAAWLFAVFSMLIGLFVLVRPSALKPLEAKANHWVEPFPTPRLNASARPIRWLGGGLVVIGGAIILARVWLNIG